MLLAGGIATAARGADDVRLRRLRDRRRRPGVLARRARAARDVGRGAAGRPGLAGAPQPPPLRRLPGPRRRRDAVRRRGGLLGLPGRARRAPRAGPERARRRLRRHATSARPPTSRPRPTAGSRRSTSARCCDVLQGRRDASAGCGPSAPTSRPRTRTSGRSRASSRARRRARSASTPAGATTSGARSRPTSAPSARASAEGDRVFTRAQAAGSRPSRPIRCSPRRCAGSPPLRRRPAARDLPVAGLAAGDVDLDRRADRLRRRR